MEAPLYNQSGEQVGTIQLDASVFGIAPNVPVMHQAMVRQQANARLGTHDTLTRSEVAGSTRKLYRQKGTGRARQGSARAPHRKGGGVAHGPHPRSYRKSMPRKMRRLAVRSALSAKYAAHNIRFIDTLSFEQPRTKDMLACLASLELEGSTLIVLGQKDERVQRSTNNIPKVKMLLAHYLNVVDLLRFDNILIAQPAVDVIGSFLSVDGITVAEQSDAETQITNQETADSADDSKEEV
ncbi:MAG: Ribosomal protein L4 [Chloroflexi bacterium AL-W]|nr:Ribosomal protein L4 [Chloroflexi bacterium AL-N1]NOK66735.1 Ribosomal protein L4 [Chloroflexi bacterium AL-N10]NOK74973.1 Ribosomal protein L4 [Chloroflexi bacterium AL-N5]NOK81338.1 Ribosomal protein L4 [Chloroflexi bacterium AL-W]NOK88807.1 Ribosomal protein L4 [Chloroflexi bacterium AL-N15]